VELYKENVELRQKGTVLIVEVAKEQLMEEQALLRMLLKQ
jgi:hypothetical protein